MFFTLLRHVADSEGDIDIKKRHIRELTREHDFRWFLRIRRALTVTLHSSTSCNVNWWGLDGKNPETIYVTLRDRQHKLLCSRDIL